LLGKEKKAAVERRREGEGEKEREDTLWARRNADVLLERREKRTEIIEGRFSYSAFKKEREREPADYLNGDPALSLQKKSQARGRKLRDGDVQR